MTLDEYQVLAARTLDPTQTAEELGANIILGLIGETGEVAELIKKNRFHGRQLQLDSLVKECGDVLWYTAAEFTGSGMKMSVIELEDFPQIDAKVAQCPLTDTLAVIGIYRTIAGGDVEAAANRMCMLSRLLQNNGSTLAAAAAGNIAKLEARWPNGFLVPAP